MEHVGLIFSIDVLWDIGCNHVVSLIELMVYLLNVLNSCLYLFNF